MKKLALISIAVAIVAVILVVPVAAQQISGEYIETRSADVYTGQCFANGVATSQLFLNRHRIRIDITSSNFPAFDRNMNTGNAIGEDAHGIVARQTVFHQKEYPSYIDLPVISK